METFIWFLVTMAAAFLFGWAAIRMKIPAGGMIGGMAGVALLNIVGGKACMYPQLRIAVQVCLGAMSGSRVGRREVLAMKRLIIPIGLMFLVCIVLNVVFGGVFQKQYILVDTTAVPEKSAKYPYNFLTPF